MDLITKLQWNGYADTYNGKAYTAKFIRVMHTLYGYYAGREDEMEKILLEKCKGTDFFVNNLMEKTQGQAFDALAEVVQYEMESVFKRSNREKAKEVALKKGIRSVN